MHHHVRGTPAEVMAHIAGTSRRRFLPSVSDIGKDLSQAWRQDLRTPWGVVGEIVDSVA